MTQATRTICWTVLITLKKSKPDWSKQKNKLFCECVETWRRKIPEPHFITMGNCKVHVFWEGHKNWQNLHRQFDSTEGSCLMRLLGIGKIRIRQKSHKPNFYFMDAVAK